MILGKVELLVMAILLSKNIAQCDDRAAVDWAWTGRNLILDEALPRAIRIWNKIPKEITEIKQPESFHAAISKLPFTTPTHLKCL